MRQGAVYIDGIDIYTNYGIYVTDGGYKGIVAFPPLKVVESNDWHEQDGIEADLAAPVLDSRDITLTFAIAGDRLRLIPFMAALTDGAYHTFNFAELGRVLRLRLSSVPNYETFGRLSTFSLRFADDFPLDGYTYVAPSCPIPDRQDYTLDGRLLSDYGVVMLKGTLSSIMRPADTKQNLLRDIATLSGVTYDGQTVTYKSREAKLNCFMRPDTVAAMWQNLDALLYDLTRAGERTLGVSVGDFADDFPCYYKSCTVSAFEPTERPWLAFELTVVITDGGKIDLTDVVLATESGDIVLAEDGESAFDMTE